MRHKAISSVALCYISQVLTLEDYIKPFQQQVEEAVEQYWLIGPYRLIDDLEKYFERIVGRLSQHQPLDTSTPASELRLCENLTVLVQSQYRIGHYQAFDNTYNSYVIALDSALSFLPYRERFVQDAKRFAAVSGDAAPVKVVKGFKRAMLHSRWAMAKLFDSDSEREYPDHEVPLRLVAQYYIKVLLTEHLISAEWQLQQKLLAELNQISETTKNVVQSGMDEAQSVPDLQDLLQYKKEHYAELKSRLRQDVFAEIHRLFDNLQQSAEKVGTIEFNAAFFSSNWLQYMWQKKCAGYNTRLSAWNKNHELLRDDWLLNIQLAQWFYAVQHERQRVYDNLKTQFDKKVTPAIQSVRDYLNASILRLDQHENSKAQMLDLLQQERTQIANELRQTLIPKVLHEVLTIKMPAMLVRLQSSNSQVADKMLSDVKVSRQFSVSRVVKRSEIQSFNPAFLVKETCIPILEKTLKELRLRATQLNNNFQPILHEVANIYAFSYESAYTSLSADKATIREVMDEIKTGDQRAAERLAALEKDYQKLIKAFNDDLEDALGELKHALLKLGSVQNALEMNIRIVQLKAQNQTLSVTKKLKYRWATFQKRANAKLTKSKKWLESLKRKTGNVLVQQSPSIEREDLNKLVDVTQSLQHLPFIYQLLFKPQPLLEFTLFQPRKDAHAQLVKAFTSWQEGHPAYALLNGAKGAGATTLFNFFVNERLTDMRVKRLHANTTVENTYHLLEMLKEVFNYSQIEKLDELVVKIKDSGLQSVVLIEQFQSFFVRAVGGFTAMKALLHFMHSTRKEVFWVCTISREANQFLQKTLHLNEYFTHNIELKPFTAEEMDHFIWQRHQVSGFDLQIHWPELAEQRKVKALEPEALQTYLRKEFTSRIAKECEGSLELALLQWVLSIEKIEQTLVHIRPIKMETGMVKNLSDKKLMMLHALLLHDGLPDHLLSKCLGYPEEECHAIRANMEKDGLVVTINGQYECNLLIYKSLIRILKSKNVLH